MYGKDLHGTAGRHCSVCEIWVPEASTAVTSLRHMLWPLYPSTCHFIKSSKNKKKIEKEKVLSPEGKNEQRREISKLRSAQYGLLHYTVLSPLHWKEKKSKGGKRGAKRNTFLLTFEWILFTSSSLTPHPVLPIAPPLKYNKKKILFTLYVGHITVVSSYWTWA